MPERDSPVTKMGEPKRNIMTLLRSAECQVAGDDWTREIAPPTASWMKEAGMARGKERRGRGLGSRVVGFGRKEEGLRWKEEDEE